MRKAIAVLFAALLFFAASLPIGAQTPVRLAAPSKPLVNHVYDSVALLYTQDESGDMKMTCTATAFAKTQTGYRFVSAAHCVPGESDRVQKLQKFYISADSKGQKNYFVAKLIQAGDKKMGDDFSIFEVDTLDHFDIMMLGDEASLKIGDRVVNVAGALGLGKEYFEGYVSEIQLDRPPLSGGEVTWTNVTLMQIGGAPGSSGSAIVSVDQNAIVGFLVGASDSDIGKICVPVSKFKAFLAAVDAGTYKKSHNKHDDDDSDDDAHRH